MKSQNPLIKQRIKNGSKPTNQTKNKKWIETHLSRLTPLASHCATRSTPPSSQPYQVINPKENQINPIQSKTHLSNNVPMPTITCHLPQ